MKKYAALLGLLLLTACNPFAPADENGDPINDDTDNMMMDDNDPSNDDDDMIDGTGATMGDHASLDAQVHSASYVAFTDDVLTNGRPKVLFFHAAWCPICRAADAELAAWYNDQRPTIDTYKVDYDARADLKAQYGVTSQHTFVLVDGEGNAIQTVQAPSDTALQALIGA